jgi:hypothetical protein
MPKTPRANWKVSFKSNIYIAIWSQLSV